MIGMALAVICMVDAIFYAFAGRFWMATFMLIPPIIWTYVVEFQMKRLRGRL